MNEGVVPFAFDAAFYTRTNGDLAAFDPDRAARHYAEFGIAEGRQGHPYGSRQAFTDRLASYASVLEIGPFCKPTARGPHVRYLDVLDEIELRERASALGADADACPEKIHYLGDIHDIDDAFPAVVSSHCIEHQPDLIHHLAGVTRVLSPGGRYFLYVPDKRYCFDHFMAESTIAEVIQAHRERRTVHTLRSVIEHHAMNTHNDPATHWAGRHDTGHGVVFADRVKNAIKMYDTADGYIDVHAWYFTPHSFANLMTALYDCGLSQLRLTEIYPTRRDDAEFYAVLERA